MSNGVQTHQLHCQTDKHYSYHNDQIHKIIVSVQIKAGTSTGRRTVTADPVDVGLFLFTL